MLFRSERGAFALENGGQVIGLLRLPQLPHHVVEDVDGFGGSARRGPHGGRAGPGPCMVGAEDETKRIDQEKARHFTMLSVSAVRMKIPTGAYWCLIPKA